MSLSKEDEEEMFNNREQLMKLFDRLNEEEIRSCLLKKKKTRIRKKRRLKNPKR